MKRHVARRSSIVFGFLTATILAGHAPVQAQVQAPRIFYVDFDGGNDGNDGLSPATAWKHAPGDPNFRNGTARLFTLLAGDTVRFRGGVRYRGSLMPRANGTADARVMLDGSSWGASRAIIDGSDAATGVRRCQSAAECFDNPHWQNLWRADVPATASWNTTLFVNDIPMQAAQWPEVQARDASNISMFQTIPRAAYADLLAGSITHSLPPGMAAGTPVLALWNRPNLIGFTPDVRVTGSGLEFVGAAWSSAAFNPYPDRDNRFAILNAPGRVLRPGLAAISPRDGIAIFWPPSINSTPRVTLGTPRTGINLARANHMVIRGFSFSNFNAHPILQRSSNIGNVIRDNSFRSIAHTLAIWAIGARDFTVFRNEFHNLVWSAGIKIDSTLGPVMIRCNRMTEITRTAISFNNVGNATVRANSIAGIRGNHANGISAYNDSRNVLIDHNIVKDAARPFTTHGARTLVHASGTPGVRVSGNIFISNSAGGAGLTSYGRTPDFVVTDNFTSGPRFGMRLAGTETGFVATGNRVVGQIAITTRGSVAVAPETNQLHNADGNGALLVQEMEKAVISPTACSG
ncbi:MAG: right-handed parallel beta-helix repeat-containing protein [Sandarakinorhabdus sp.]|nr:right-handed parallel beta-helix repeat-containing protein [Sandarakinorhabdus sp.]